MKDFLQSPKIKIFLSVLLVLIMLAVFTRNVENNFVSTTLNTLTYGLSKVTAAATADHDSNKSYDELKAENEAHVHKFFDNLPLSENKIEYINKNVPVDQRWEYFFPLIKYHGLWTEYPERLHMIASNLTLDARGFNYLKGFRTTAYIHSPDKPCLNDKLALETGELDLDPKLEKQLNDLLDYCDEQHINLMFVRAPHYVTQETYNRVKRSNKMASIVNSRGYSYYTLENDVKRIGIDEKHDFYNVDHMNVYGAIKFTDYLSEKILYKEELKVDPLSDEQKENWSEVVTATNQLYRYCDDIMTNTNKEKGAQEDVWTLLQLGDYSGAPIQRTDQP